MKKKILALFLTLASTQLMAENVHELIKEMGYTQDYIYENVPVNSIGQKYRHKKNIVDKNQNYLMPAEDFLKPRIYETSESSTMIPLLLRLQKKNPTSAKLTKKLAVTCYKSGQYKEALYWYTQTYLRNRSDFESLWNMASIAYELNMKDKVSKYLKEYAKADPNSAWGRMAREFLKNNYSNNLKDAFKKQNARVGYIEDGDTGSKSGILVVEGKKTNIESLVLGYQATTDLNSSKKNNVRKTISSPPKKPNRKLQKANSLATAKIKENKLPIVKAKPLQ